MGWRVSFVVMINVKYNKDLTYIKDFNEIFFYTTKTFKLRRKSMKKIVLISLASASIVFGAANIKACKGCHGQTWEKPALGKSKVVKDMSKQEIIDSLKGYQNGTYGGALKGMMLGQVKNLNDADITALAEDAKK